MTSLRRTALIVMLLASVLAPSCGDSASEPTPQPTPTPELETWFVGAVLCTNCPGLTNVVFDNTTEPPRAKLPVGKLTSIRAIAKLGCGTEQSGFLNITRWDASDPRVIKIEASSPESAIVTALSVGTSRITAERVLPNGTVSQGRFLGGLRVDLPCTPQPEMIFEVVP